MPSSSAPALSQWQPTRNVGIGASAHIFAEFMNSMAGIKVIHVPYKGGGPAMTGAFIKAQIEKWTPFVKSSSARVDGIPDIDKCGQTASVTPRCCDARNSHCNSMLFKRHRKEYCHGTARGTTRRRRHEAQVHR
ncbi:MAG: tripartite tricarboxylate transporter substrate-binding protein [Burkholderiales bacterium]